MNWVYYAYFPSSWQFLSVPYFSSVFPLFPRLRLSTLRFASIFTCCFLFRESSYCIFHLFFCDSLSLLLFLPLVTSWLPPASCSFRVSLFPLVSLPPSSSMKCLFHCCSSMLSSGFSHRPLSFFIYLHISVSFCISAILICSLSLSSSFFVS